MRLFVATAVLEALEGMDMDYPSVTPRRLKEMKGYRAKLVED